MGMRLCVRRRPERPEDHREERIELVVEHVDVDLCSGGEQQLAGPDASEVYEESFEAVRSDDHPAGYWPVSAAVACRGREKAPMPHPSKM
jgi:hypothetical protein